MEDCREELSLTRSQIREHPVYVGERNGALVGFYMLVALPEKYAGMAELDHFWVAPAAMGTGVGRALFEHAAGVAAGCTAIDIHSDPHAADFYRRMGCRDAGEAPSGSVPGRCLPRLVLDI